MSTRPNRRPAARRGQIGLNLVELMVGMFLGLIVMGGVVGVFLANNETNKGTESLARIQENARIAFEFMSRSLREAGSNPCGTLPASISLASGLSSTNWWTGGEHFGGAIKGYENGVGFPAASSSITPKSNSDALILVSGTTDTTQISNTDTPGVFKVLSIKGYAKNDILMACNTNSGLAAIFRTPGAPTKAATSANKNAGNIAHSLAAPLDKMTSIARLSAEGWFIGKNERGGWSLFRTWFSDAPEEIASDVTDMQLTYLVQGENDYRLASAIAADDWANVVAIHIEITFASASDATGSAADTPRMKNAIERKIEHIATLRNRSTTR
jgi:type IV pilus assembly protein PilW